jgi:hypothetical protein
MNADIRRDGFALIGGVVAASEQKALRVALGDVNGAGRRGLLALPEVAALARSSMFLDLVRAHLPAEPEPVRAIYFDKSPTTNWRVAWHQDLTLAVRTAAEVPGFGPWSMKDGIPHVQPPVEMLERMITVRLHLDDADESNGALRVIPGSHRRGRLSAAQIQSLRREWPEFLCRARAGDVLLMRPLLLHASGRSSSHTHRRVLHIEYAGFALPDNLAWNEVA